MIEEGAEMTRDEDHFRTAEEAAVDIDAILPCRL